MPRNAVLVHGGFHGGWCWKRVAEPLRQQGWVVHAPSLTGVGDRYHLLSEKITQNDRISDIVNIIEFEELDDVVLCGHSAGGPIITGVAELIPERIAHLIYLDAVVPTDGQSLLDVVGNGEGLVDSYNQQAAEGNGWQLSSKTFTAEAFGVTDPADQRWVESKMTDDSLPIWQTPLKVGDGWASIRRKTFIRAERFPLKFHDGLYEKFTADPGWETDSWDVGHDVMIEMPEKVIALFNENVV